MELLQPLLIVCLVLALGAMLWKSGRGSVWFQPRPRRQLELLDRVSLTHQHSVHLVRVQGRWMALAVTPKGVELLESGEFAGAQPDPGDLSFPNLFDSARIRSKAVGSGAAQ